MNFPQAFGDRHRLSHLSARCNFFLRSGRRRTKGTLEEHRKKKLGLVPRVSRQGEPGSAWFDAVRESGGFTLVEVLIISPIMMVTIIIIMTLLFNQYGQLTQQGAQINLNVEAQNITFSMQDDIFFANAFKQTINDNLVDSYQPGGGWQYNSSPPTFIVSAPALTASRRSESREPVYIDTEGCDPSVIEQNEPLYNNVIYFVSGGTLQKRILSAPSSMSTCGTSFMKQSCPPANATNDCPPDRLLTDKLDSINFTYYDAAIAVVTNPEVAQKVKIDLTLKDRAFAEDITATSSITLKRLNQ